MIRVSNSSVFSVPILAYAGGGCRATPGSVRRKLLGEGQPGLLDLGAFVAGGAQPAVQFDDLVVVGAVPGEALVELRLLLLQLAELPLELDELLLRGPQLGGRH